MRTMTAPASRPARIAAILERVYEPGVAAVVVGQVQKDVVIVSSDDMVSLAAYVTELENRIWDGDRD